ncbi:MAG: dCMP deaminase family protein [Nanoarchaeota archaeon]
MGKRKNYISWDDYFMSIVVLSGKRSKDPNTQVGACIVNEDKKIVGIGYNGFPKGVSDDVFPWAREGNFLDTKYPYVCHAELNAILNSFGRDLNGSTLYVQMFPCNECAKSIIQSGIKKIIYLTDKYEGTDPVIASKKMFDSAGIKYERLVPKEKEIKIELE